MNADILNDLAARVEALQGADREADARICIALGLSKGNVMASVEGWCINSETNPNPYMSPAYTASIDAARTLVPTDAFWRVGHDADDPAWMMAQVSYDRGEGRLGFTTGTAETAAMAMTAASLRAHAAIAKENEGG